MCEVFVLSLLEFTNISDNFPKTSENMSKDVLMTFEQSQSYLKRNIYTRCDKVRTLKSTFI